MHKMDLEQLMMRNEGEILKYNRKYSIDNLRDIDEYQDVDKYKCKVYNLITKNSQLNIGDGK